MANIDLIGYASGKLKRPGASGDEARLGDNVALSLGASQEFKILNNGTNSTIQTSDALLVATANNVGVSIGHSSSTVTIGNNLTVTGDLTVNGTTTTVNSTTISVDDKNLELGSVASPSDTSADGGGITLKGASDKTLNWVNLTDSWTSSEHFDLASGKEFKIAGTSVLNATTLGGAVVNSSLTSVGTIATGVWEADDVAIAHGGTGASSAADARTNLGLAIGSDVQAYDAELAALAGLTSAADKGIQFTGSGTAATYDLTAAGKALLDDADAAAQRNTLGLVIGTNVQAYDDELAALAGLTSAANKGIQFTGSGTAATYDLTAAGKALLDDADADAQLVTLGLTATATELNIMDGGTSATTTSLADADRIVVNDDGTMKQVALTDLATYVGTGGGAQGNNALNASIATSEAILQHDVVAINITAGTGTIVKAQNDAAADMEVIGVATGGIDSGAGSGTDIHSAWGKKVTVHKITTETYDIGEILYVSATEGLVTKSPPSANNTVVYRVGYSLQKITNNTTESVDIIWMPQYITNN